MSCVFGIVIDNSSNVDLEDKATGILSSVEEVKTLMKKEELWKTAEQIIENQKIIELSICMCGFVRAKQ